MELKEYIEYWKVDLLRPAKSDVLVNINPGLNAISIDRLSSDIESEKKYIEPSSLLNKIIKSNKLSEKTAGVSTLGLSSYAIQFSLADKDFFAPVFIYNTSAIFDRIKNKFEITKKSSPFFNPFLEKLLDLHIEEYSIEMVESVLLEKGLDFKLLDEVYIGNFHPHRFIILKEIETLSNQKKYNNALLELFGETAENQIEFKFPNQNVLFADDFQNSAIKDLQNNNIVLQGPPGTGKSDVITNIIAKSMAAKYKTLFIAEQQTAVNVIYEKLKTHQLHYFCAQLHHNLTAKEYVEDLKQTWKHLESLNKSKVVNMNRSYYMIQNLQMLLDKLNAKSLYGGLSFGEFKAKCQQSTFQGELQLTSLPELENWVNDRELLQSVLPSVGKIQSYLWTYINISELNCNNDKRQKDFGLAYDAYQRMNDQLDKINDFDELQRKVMFAQLFFYDDKLLDRELFKKDTKKQIAFKKLRSQQKTLAEKINLYTNEKNNWNKELNESELFEFLEVLQSNDRFSLPNWIKKRELKKLSKVNLNSAKTAIENLLHLREFENKFVDTKAQLRELDLPDDLSSLDQINLLIDKSASISENIFKQLIDLDKQKIIELYNCSSDVQLLSDFIKRHFLFKPEIEWSLFFADYRKHKNTIAGSEEWLSKMSLSSKKMLFELRNNYEIKELDKIVYQSHWDFLSAKFPELTALEPSKVGKILDDILEQEKQDQIDFAKSITYDLKCAFEEAHDLLQVPARKLSEEEKLRKSRLRKGKSILVKQFAKSRNHLSPLELMKTEAAEWISLLKPIVSGSSIGVAKNLPFNKEDFDLVLFDEASQIHLSNAVGSIYRGKRVMVAGDSQQMPPSNLFNKGSQDIDLLAQSTFYWNNRILQYHYRSHHDELIAFSNSYFYQNKLRAFPFYNADFPIEVIDLNGVFEDRVNLKEAHFAAKVISEKIKNDDFSFGIVAFSQKQLDAILAALPKNDYIKLMERENEILMSSLEHVQGEQCDHLIISLGYAFNREGKFLHQFGPLNKDGGHRRLNVLMSRARKKITFIRSVNENDFKISENDGVDMLRKLMVYLSKVEINTDDSTSVLAKEENTFLVKSFYKEVPEALNLLSVHNVLKSRNWKVEYIF